MEGLGTEPTFQVVLLFKEGATVEELVDYGDFRYHLLVQYNEAENCCVENALLEKMYDALDAEDDGALDQARNACIGLVWPFMIADHAERAESKQRPNGTIKLQAVTKHGIICATSFLSRKIFLAR
jgi:hypothetical protein